MHLALGSFGDKRQPLDNVVGRTPQFGHIAPRIDDKRRNTLVERGQIGSRETKGQRLRLPGLQFPAFGKSPQFAHGLRQRPLRGCNIKFNDLPSGARTCIGYTERYRIIRPGTPDGRIRPLEGRIPQTIAERIGHRLRSMGREIAVTTQISSS